MMQSDHGEPARSDCRRGRPPRLTCLVFAALVSALLLPGCSLSFGNNQGSHTPDPAGTVGGSSIATNVTNQTNPIADVSPTSVVAGSPTPREPKPTGTQALTLTAGTTDPRSLDPALTQDLRTTEIERQLFRGLVKLNPDMSASPDLAEKVDLSHDGLTYTFHLRKGLKFSSGRPLRASDVQFSMNRALDPALARQTGGVLPALIFLSDIQGASDRASGKTDHISGITVRDDLTLTLTLIHPVGDFLVKLAGVPASVVSSDDVQKGGDWWRSPDTSGPFRVGSWDPGKQIVLKANLNYLPQPPTLKTVTLLLGSQAEQPFTLYERHQVDLAEVPIDAIDRVQAPNSPYKDQLVVQPQLSMSYILLNPNVAPFNDINVRRAMIVAFDRTKIADVTYDGHVQVANSIVPAELDGIDWSAAIPAYDPAEAKSLLQQASLDPNGSGIVFYTLGDYAPVAMKVQLEQNLGLKSDVVQEESSDYLMDVASQKLPALSFGWIADYPGPEDFLRELFYSTSDENPIGYHNSEVDKLLDEADRELDPAKRAALYEQVQQLIIDDAVVIPLYSDIDYELVEPYVHGLQLTPVGILGFESVWVTK